MQEIIEQFNKIVVAFGNEDTHLLMQIAWIEA
jgi:hypothetical protein